MTKIAVVIYRQIRYNISNLRCAITFTSFEPTFTLNGIHISPNGCQASTTVLASSDRSGRQKFGCGYPPSIARSQKVKGGILGNMTKEGAVRKGCSFKLRPNSFICVYRYMLSVEMPYTLSKDLEKRRHLDCVLCNLMCRYAFSRSESVPW